MSEAESNVARLRADITTLGAKIVDLLIKPTSQESNLAILSIVQERQAHAEELHNWQKRMGPPRGAR
jgi:hypothetical protein